MENRLQFNVQEGTGVFIYPNERLSPLLDEFDELLDSYQSGEMKTGRYVAELSRLIVQEPDFIDLHAHLSFSFYKQDKPKKALDAALAGLAIGNRFIPEGFDGLIEWHSLGNRPFLRAMHGAVLAYVRLRKHRDATILMNKMLAYNPNDNQGVSCLLGSEMLRSGDRYQAEKVFSEYADSYPPYFYELALTHILKSHWVEAATALRQGFSENSYISEILCGNPCPQPLAIWHGINLAEPDIAVDYIEMYGELWFRHPESLAFVRWLFNHSSVMAERAQWIKCSEELFSEHGLEARRRIMNRQQALLDGIDHQLSTKIIKKIQNQRGKEIWPWMQQLE